MSVLSSPRTGVITAFLVVCFLLQVRIGRCDILIAGAPLPLQTSSAHSVQARSVFLIPGDLPAGLLFGIKAVFVDNTSPVTIQVWRPPTANLTNNSSFNLVAQYPPNVFLGQLRSEQQYNLSNADGQNTSCVPVKAGDRLGVYFDTHGSIAYYFDTDVLMISYLQPNMSVSYAGAFTVGQKATFSQLVFPYQFQITAFVDSNTNATCNSLQIPSDEAFVMTTMSVTGPPGPVGATGATGGVGADGATGPIGMQGPPGSQGATGAIGPVGPVGPPGSIGATGMPGDKGAVGPIGLSGPIGAMGDNGTVGVAGPPGPAGPPGLGNTQKSTSNLNNESFVTGMIIWLAILSFIVILLFIFLLILCCCHCRLQKRRKEEREEAAKAKAESQAQGPRSATNAAYLQPTPDEFDATARKQSVPEVDVSGRHQPQQADYYNSGYEGQGAHHGGGAASGAYHTEPMHDSRDADNDRTYVSTMRGEEEQDFPIESISREPSQKVRPVGMSRPAAADGNTDEML